MTTAPYQERPAPPGLGLACVWSQHTSQRYVQRVVPDACVDLIWSAADGEIHVAGPDTGPFLAELVPGDALVGVRFAPGRAVPSLGGTAEALRDARIPLREIWGDDAEIIAAAVGAAGDRGAALAAAVAARVRSAGPADPAAPALVDRLTNVSVREAADDLGLSERQLRRRAQTAFGYGPKTLQRVLRFQRALRLAREGRQLAEVAYTAGYSDQSHLSHEVHDLAGAPLRRLLAPG